MSLDIDGLIATCLESNKTGKPASIPETRIRSLCLQTSEVLLNEPPLLRVRAPINIIGDIHGQFNDLIRHFEEVGYPDTHDFIFLGDYVDRGNRSLETIILLLAYKLKYKDRFFLLRGNHECANINRIYGFYDECKRRYNIKLWKTFTDCFNCLPLGGVVENAIFCIHGGMSPDLIHIDQISSFERPAEIPDHGIASDLLWSDPDEDITGWGENDRGVSYTFGCDQVNKFLENNNLALIARAHQVVEDGYQFFARRRLVTLFSAPNYCGEFDNAGATMSVAKNLLCEFHVLKPRSLTDRLEAEKVQQKKAAKKKGK